MFPVVTHSPSNSDHIYSEGKPIPLFTIFSPIFIFPSLFLQAALKMASFDQQQQQQVPTQLQGWELANRGIQLALNNRVEEAQKLLRGSGPGCMQSQAGYCFLTFMVSRRAETLELIAGS